MTTEKSTSNTVSQAVAVLFSLAFNMEVSKTVKKDGKSTREKLGTVAVQIPTLADLGIEAEVKETDKETGLPVYVDQVHEFLFGAVFDAVTKSARNRLEGLELKNPALPLASNLADFMAVNRTNNLGLINQFKKSFRVWVASLGKSATAQAQIISYTSADNLALATKEHKQKFLGYLEQYAEDEAHKDYLDFVAKLAEVAEEETEEATDF